MLTFHHNKFITFGILSLSIFFTYIYIYVCVYMCVIKMDRHFVSAYYIFDRFNSPYESFDFGWY